MAKYKVKQNQNLGEIVGNKQISVTTGQIIEGTPQVYFIANKNQERLPYMGLSIPMDNLDLIIENSQTNQKSESGIGILALIVISWYLLNSD